MHIPSRIATRLLLCCAIATAPAFALAQDAAAAKPAKPPVGTAMSPSETYGKLLGMMEKEFVDAAEAMPEDKFDFAPPAAAGDFKGVRSFGAQVKHVADANYYFFGGSMSEADMKAKHDAIEKMTSKADIV
jgi:hypothetical protein